MSIRVMSKKVIGRRDTSRRAWLCCVRQSFQGTKHRGYVVSINPFKEQNIIFHHCAISSYFQFPIELAEYGTVSIAPCRDIRRDGGSDSFLQ